MLRAICFSKDRPLQLEAFIESLMHYSGLKAEYFSVIFTSSSGITYDRLIERHPQIDWIPETDFQSNVRAAVAKSDGWVLLGCDDVVFKDYFDPNVPIGILQRDPSVFGFSLRLGTNIRFLPDVERVGEIFSWDWRRAKNDYWRYPWEVSASIYRREFVLNYLDSRSDLSNPNRLEAYLAGEIAAKNDTVPPKCAMFATSRSTTITMNRVQDEFPNEFDDSRDTDPKALFERYEAGLHFDWPRLFRWSNKSVHTGSEAFEFSETIAPPKIAYVAESEFASAEQDAFRFFRARILYWRAMIFLWENARKYMPEALLNAARKFSRLRSARAIRARGA